MFAFVKLQHCNLTAAAKPPTRPLPHVHKEKGKEKPQVGLASGAPCCRKQAAMPPQMLHLLFGGISDMISAVIKMCGVRWGCRKPSGDRLISILDFYTLSPELLQQRAQPCREGFMEHKGTGCRKTGEWEGSQPCLGGSVGMNAWCYGGDFQQCFGKQKRALPLSNLGQFQP